MRRVSILLSVLALVLLLTSVDAGGPVTPVMRTDGTNADSPVFPGPVTVTGQTTLGNASATVLDVIEDAIYGSSKANVLCRISPAERVMVGPNVGGGGNYSTFVGSRAGAGWSGEGNTVIGRYAGYNYGAPGGATDNTAVGVGAGMQISGSYNSAFGSNAIAGLSGIVRSDSYAAAFGYAAGKYLSNGTTPNASSTVGNTYLGAIAKSGSTLAAGSTNETVIGYDAVGLGSNSVVIGNTSVTLTVLRSGTCIGTNTVAVGYGATIASGCYVQGDVSADQFTDRSDAPESLAEAYAIIQSHEAKDGKVDHSKLHAAAWGRKFRVVETGKTIVKTREIAPAEEGGKATIEEYSEPEKVVISEPDQQGRNLSMVISAQALVIADLAKRLEALEAAQK